MKVSIIVPIYNTEKYLNDALDSLVNQTLKDIEIICINDGSTDKSLSILESYAQKDERIKIISQPNLGQSAARNAGLKIATGEYIGFLDSDDWMDETAIEKLYTNAQHADISICSITTHLNKIKNAKDPYLSTEIFPKSFEQKSFNAEDCKNFLFRISVTPWNKIYKREFLKENNITFKEGINFEDNIFFLETFTAANSIRLTTVPLVNYRIDSTTSYSHGKNDFKKLDFFKIVNAQEKIFKSCAYFNKEMFELHKKSTLLYWFKKISNPKTKVLYWLKLFKIYPSILLSPITKKHRTQKLLKKIQPDNYIWLEPNSKIFLNNLFTNYKINIKGFVTNKKEDNSFMSIPVFTPEELPAAAQILTISSSYYKWGELINSKLDKKYNIQNILLPLW